MKDLKCGLKECKYNKGYCCCAKNIDVNCYTDCTTFSVDKNLLDNPSLFEAASEFPKANYSIDTQVNCSAKCIFNKNNKCVSNGITIMSEGSEEAVCLTFVKD